MIQADKLTLFVGRYAIRHLLIDNNTQIIIYLVEVWRTSVAISASSILSFDRMLRRHSNKVTPFWVKEESGKSDRRFFHPKIPNKKLSRLLRRIEIDEENSSVVTYPRKAQNHGTSIFNIRY